MSGRSYVRTFTDQAERWAGLSDGEYRLLMELTLLAAEQHPAGRFRSVEVLRAFAPIRLRRHVTRLYALAHLVVLPTGEVYVDGWDEDQEGDWKVAERMARRRARRRASWSPTVTTDTPPTVTNDTPPPVTSPYGSGSGKSITNGSGTPEHQLRGQAPLDGGRFADAYKAYEHITGKKPDAKQEQFLDDLSGQFTREAVARTLYAQPDCSEYGLIGRVSGDLRRGRS